MSHQNFCTGFIRSGVRLASRILYRVLSPARCTRLASTRLGNAIGKIIAPSHDAVYACAHGIKLRLSREDAITSGVAYMGQTNPLETGLLFRFLRPGDTVIEIGTYKDGWLALVSSGIVGPTGHVICFEPMPAYCQAFRQNVELNGRNNIFVEQLAVSDTVGTATFSMCSTNSSLVLSRDASSQTIAVQTTTLDSYFAAHRVDSVALAIIDAEGAETRIIQGATQVLSRTTHLLVEVVDAFCRQAGTTADGLIREISASGFTPFVITRGGLVQYEPGKQSETMNMFFVREGADHR